MLHDQKRMDIIGIINSRNLWQENFIYQELKKKKVLLLLYLFECHVLFFIYERATELELGNSNIQNNTYLGML